MNIIDYKDLTLELARKGCFVINMPNEAYHAYQGISKSGLDLINRSPAHYAHREQREPTRAMVIGSAIHAAILEPEVFERDYLLLRDVTDRRASAYKEAVKTRSEEFVLTGKEADHVKGMQDSVFLNREATELLSAEGWVELSAFVECNETGALLKARFDKLNADGTAVDLKSTTDIRYEQFQRSIGNYRYHVQDAHYSRVFHLITGYNLKAFKFVCVESASPHASKIYRLDDESRNIGYRAAMADLAVYAECERTGEWPYPDGSEELITLPAWALDDEAEAEVML